MRNYDEIMQAIQNGEDVTREELMKFWHYGGIDKFFGNEDGSFFGSLRNIYDDVTGKSAQDDAIAAQKEMQEDAQDFAHTERLEQNDWELALHRMQLLDDPSLQMQGLKAIGMSDAAAAQAILGSQGSFGIGAASNGAAPMGSVSPVPPQSGLADLLSNLPKKIQDVRKAKQEIVFSQQQVKESNKLIEKYGQDIAASVEQINLAKKLNESQIGLNGSIVQKNMAELDKIANESALFLAKAGLVEKEGAYLDAQTAHEWAMSSLTNKQATKVQQEIDNEIVKKTGQVLDNQAGLYSTQAKGQEYENYSLYIRNATAKALGCNPDDDLVTQFMECCATGNYNTIGKLITASNIGQTNGGFSGLTERALTSIVMSLLGVEETTKGITR